MTLSSGKRVTLFRPLEPYETPDAVQDGTITRLGSGRKTHYVRSDALE